MPMAANSPGQPGTVGTIEQVAQSMRHGGDSGRRVIMVGTMRNVGTTHAAISLARRLAQDANVALVDMAFASPNLSIISDDPKAPGIAELVRGTATFGQIITGDQYSNVHLVAAGQVGGDARSLAASPILATLVEALVRSYDHVVVDIGAAGDGAIDRLAPLAARAVLVSADPANAATRVARERLLTAGIAEVTLMVGAPQVIAA
jgi:Mrp family chromosome partitioning ATPase